MAIFNSYVCLPEGTWILFGYGSKVLKISWWFIRLSHYLKEAFNHPKLVQDFAGPSTVCSELQMIHPRKRTSHPIWHVSDPTGPTAWHDITRTRPCNMICFIGVISEVETLTTSVYTSTCHLHPSNIASLQPRGFSKLKMIPLCFPHICLLFWKERDPTYCWAIKSPVGASSSHAATIAPATCALLHNGIAVMWEPAIYGCCCWVAGHVHSPNVGSVRVMCQPCWWIHELTMSFSMGCLKVAMTCEPYQCRINHFLL